MTLFSIICDIVGLVSNICILILTVFTLYLTAFSKRMDFVSMWHSFSAFFGGSFCFYIRNRSLHSIPITKVFLLKRMGGMFHKINVANYDQPLIVDAWHIGKIETEPFTQIEGINETEEESENDSGDRETDLTTIHMDAVIGVETGNKIIWIKPYKKAPFRAARKAYKKFNFDVLNVSRTQYNDKVLSKSVNYVINLLGTDLNGQNLVKSIFAIAGEQDVLLSDPICGYNGIDGNFGSSAKELKKYICDRFSINEKNIRVDKIEHIF